MAYRVAERPPGICPLCDGNLRASGISNDRYEVCPRCQGMMVGEPTLAALCADMNAGAAPLQFVEASAHDEPRRCPRCRDTMAKVRLPFRSAGGWALLLDRCALDGVWFDRHELEELLRTVGLEGIPGPEQPPSRAAVVDGEVPRLRTQDNPVYGVLIKLLEIIADIADDKRFV